MHIRILLLKITYKLSNQRLCFYGICIVEPLHTDGLGKCFLSVIYVSYMEVQTVLLCTSENVCYMAMSAIGSVHQERFHCTCIMIVSIQI